MLNKELSPGEGMETVATSEARQVIKTARALRCAESFKDGISHSPLVLLQFQRLTVRTPHSLQCSGDWS